ncbi:carbonic anhydrase 15 isoform X2 [Anolis carolinensis]|uniref:carbonic anhydrase 15 isoform X2 n=1 Tax=Anolis carolinensis TaxID=28377 RepID=UPI000203A4D9|nr:PREDICTED: carbonic anhydrase 15 [Anolis carolinensis]|eukprot:XP_008115548.1 PREDICTED: carbonic anhydrase 15 [Anolis carolinensis]
MMRIPLLLGITLPLVLAGPWCYDGQDSKCGPLHWKEIMPACGGDNQSPINIVRRKSQWDKDLDEILFEGYDQAPPGRWRLLNDGHTVVLNLGGAPAAEQINITKGGLHGTYQALQFHFHWGDLNHNGSEHTLDGIQYPMELHIVHINSKYKTISEAKGHPNGLAVLAFLFKVSDADNTNYNTIVAALKNISQADNYVDLASTFPLSNLLPDMPLLSKYYRYKGSLTTPNCDEVVTWTVFEELIPLSKSQLDAFKKMLYFRKMATTSRMTNNFRPIQPLHSRKVYASRDATISSCSRLAPSFVIPLFLYVLVGLFSGPS